MVGTKIAVNILLLVSFPAVPAVETNGIWICGCIPVILTWNCPCVVVFLSDELI
jgi:hypothetical protein